MTLALVRTVWPLMEVALSWHTTLLIGLSNQPKTCCSAPSHSLSPILLPQSCEKLTVCAANGPWQDCVPSTFCRSVRAHRPHAQTRGALMQTTSSEPLLKPSGLTLRSAQMIVPSRTITVHQLYRAAGLHGTSANCMWPQSPAIIIRHGCDQLITRRRV